jgi:hypothetical protein
LVDAVKDLRRTSGVKESKIVVLVEQFGPIPHDRPFGPLGKFGSILAANSANCAVLTGCAGL